MNVAREVFVCRKCGHCCQGKGGIALSDKDLGRLADHLETTVEKFIEEYAEISNGKLKIRCGEDGYCVFFRAGTGCAAHVAKPDICRAWPYFRGNLEDPVSLDLAKDFCPGIKNDAGFAEFGRAGLAYLRENNLVATDAKKGPNSLVIDIKAVMANWNE